MRTGEEELCFITSDAQLLHFGAALVRPQGRAGGGVAGHQACGRRPGGLLRGAHAVGRSRRRHGLGH
ncbi:MAG: hypothetical protein WKF83_04060 [Nocardioidaceae bacterium]